MKRIYLLGGGMLALLSTQSVSAQSIWPSIINSAGGSTVLSGITHEWSVGEMTLVNTFTTSSIVVTQGVLQTNLNDSRAMTEDVSLGDLIQVFPNPANTYVNVNFNSRQDGRIQFRMMDITGKIVTEQTQDIHTGINSSKIDMANLAAATYMLQLTFKPESGQESLISYKIQKLQ